MTGLQVWLHPSSRTKSVFGSQFSVKTQGTAALTENRESGTVDLHSAPFRRPATVVRNRGRVLDGPHFDSRGGEGADGRFAARSGTAHPHVYAAHPMIASHAGGIRRGLLRGKRRPFTRAAKAERARTLPRQHVATHVRNGHDGVVKRSLNVHQSVGNVLALFLLERLLLAFFLGRRCGACCCWFCHNSC